MDLYEEHINRSKALIDKSTFKHLMELNFKYSWLQSKPDALYELWMMADNDEQHDLLDLLLSNFVIIDSEALSEASSIMANQICSSWGLVPEHTIVAAICDTNNPDGSQFILQSMKNKFPLQWKSRCFTNSFLPGLHSLSNDSILVLVDDFIGTGNTVKRKVRYAFDFLKNSGFDNVPVYVIALSAMRFSETILSGLGVEYYSVYWLNRGITEVTEEPLRSRYVSAMKEMEAKLRQRINGNKLPSLGYQQSEALLSICDINVPNNVFPIFWWPQYKGGYPRDTLFKRI